MYKKLSLSIALYGLLITPLSPLGVYESYNIVDFVNRNFETDDQSKPNLVKTHYPLSYQSPNILTNIEGVPNLDTQSKVSSQMMTSQMPKFLIAVSQIDENEKSIYIVNQVKVINQNGRISKVLHR
jgi:hypothetical protein|tara:strand:+ start:1454 stop:1831 length:378 start_codon:yes stop_codon:yes gene_type:complete